MVGSSSFSLNFLEIKKILGNSVRVLPDRTNT